MNAMLAQIESLPAMLREIAQPFDDAVRSSLDHKLCLSAKRLFITGCGDSHHAALGAELAFETLAALPTEALTAMQFARYAAPVLQTSEPGTNVVFGISVSGEVSRTLEALLMGKKAGATPVALTATPGSRIANAASVIISTVTPSFKDPAGIHVPGVRSYIANQLALYLTAIRIGEIRGAIGSAQAAEHRRELLHIADLMAETIRICTPAAEKAAETWKDASEFVFAGAGPNFGSALFSAAKILEASGDPALGQETEEWAHLQYFARDVATPTFFISPNGNETSRSMEVVEAARTIGRRVGVICPASASNLISRSNIHLPLAAGVREMFSPLVATIPGMLFAAFRSDVIGEPYFRNFTGGRSQEGGGGISRIRTSELWQG